MGMLKVLRGSMVVMKGVRKNEMYPSEGAIMFDSIH